MVSISASSLEMASGTSFAANGASTIIVSATGPLTTT